MPRNNKTSRTKPDEIEERERAIKALLLRKKGMAFPAIAVALEFADESGARHAVTRLLKRYEREDVEAMRELENQRLDLLHAAVWNAALQGDTRAVLAIVKIMERRAKLNGLDAPTQITTGDEPIQIQVMAIDYRASLASIAPVETRSIPDRIPPRKN